MKFFKNKIIWKSIKKSFKIVNFIFSFNNASLF